MSINYTVRLSFAITLISWMFVLTSTYAGTTNGTVVGLHDSGENNWELVVKDDHGKKVGFSINSYDEYQHWNDKANKGRKVSITWSTEGSGKYASKVLNKIEVVEAGQTSTPSANQKIVKILKISDFSEAADSISTDNGEYILQTYNKKYKKIKNKLKASIGQKVTLILDKDGENLISDIK